MKSFITEVFALYNIDDRGYNMGKPLSYWPIQAAAEAAKTNGYKNVYSVKILNLNEEKYHLKSEKDITNSLTEKIKSFIPIVIFQNYIYHDGFDKSVYFVNLDHFLNKLEIGKTINMNKNLAISDGEKTFLLERAEPVNIEKLKMSRELAISHAMSKLTKEEKSLLGL